MKTFLKQCAVVAMVAISIHGYAAPDPMESVLSMAVSLDEGSRILGTPNITSLAIQTSYAKMDIPLEQTSTLTIGADHETADIVMQNGDKLKGVLTSGPFKLATIFGEVSIAIEHVVKIQILRDGKKSALALKRGLILHLPFDKNDELRTMDASSTGNHGDIHGATWTAQGKVGGAYSFDGMESFIELKPTDIYQTRGELGGSAWIYRRDRSALIMSNYRGGSAYSGQFFFAIDGGGHLEVLFGQGPDQYIRYSSENVDLVPANEWHHVAFSYAESRGEGRKIKLYIDGKEIDGRYSIQREGNGGPILQTSDRLRIMAHQAEGYGCRSKGMVDDVMLFNRALSDDEIYQLWIRN